MRVDAHDQAVLLRRAGQQLRADRGDLGRRRARCSRRSATGRSTSACRTTRSPPAGPAGGAAAAAAARTDRQARARVARRRPGADVRRAGAGAGRRGAAGAAGAGRRAGAAAAAAGDAAANADQGGRGGRAPQRKDRLYQWLPPFDEASKKVIYENPTRMTGQRFSPDMKILFFSERAGQNTVESAVYLADPAREIHARALPRRRHLRQSRHARRHARVGGGGGRGAAAAAAAAAVAAADRCCSRRTAASVFFQGTAYDKNPQRGRSEDLHRQGRDQDRREGADLRERQQRRVRARVDGRSTPTQGRSSSRAKDPTTVPQQYPGAERHAQAAHEEPGLHARPHQRRTSSASRRAAGRLQVPRRT